MHAASTSLERVIQSHAGGISDEVAHFLLSLSFSESDQLRCQELSQKAQSGSLTQEETIELDDLLTTNDLLTILKSKARKRLNQPPASAA